MGSSTNTWHQKAAALRADGRAFINGTRTSAVDGDTLDDISPIDGRTLGSVARCKSADVDLAVLHARAAVNDGRWSRQSPRDRKRTLMRFGDLIEQHANELALLETLDMGKPISASLGVDVPATANCVRWYGEAIDKIYDEIAPTGANTLALITREPVGVVAAIVPWNYPMLMAAWKIAPALASGNSVILKPSEKSPLSAMRLAELARDAGLPDGVFNVLPGLGGEAGEALALHPDIDCIGFTGSTATGKRIVECAGRSNLKRAWTELGGKSPFIVFADADLDQAARACAGSIFFNQGESCNAPSRLLVDATIEGEMLERILALAPAYSPGDPLEESTVMGAIVDESQLVRVLSFIESGKREGALLRYGGTRVREETGGCYVAPTVFAGVSATMAIARDEIFGPVLSIMSFGDRDQALHLANETTFGLAGSVWTHNIDVAHSVARQLRVGTVHVNCYDEDDITVPFGGYKQSGNGRDKSLHALEKYTELKTTWIRLAEVT